MFGIFATLVTVVIFFLLRGTIPNVPTGTYSEEAKDICRTIFREPLPTRRRLPLSAEVREWMATRDWFMKKMNARIKKKQFVFDNTGYTCDNAGTFVDWCLDDSVL